MSNQRDLEVGWTARVMAALRAIETRRADRLFEDAFAEELAGAETIEQAAVRLQEDEAKGEPFVIVRTRFFDDFLIRCASEVQQVVLLGAGLDTRAFRLPWQPQTHVYEIDQPHVLQYKESVLKGVTPKCHRHSIAADLRQPWSELLLLEGYQPSLPSVWLLEGLLYYLKPVEVQELLTTMSDLTAPGSRFAADVLSEAMLNSSDEWVKYWHFGCDDPESFFADYGWKASVIQPGQEGASYGRYTYQFPARDQPNGEHIFLVTASHDSRSSRH